MKESSSNDLIAVRLAEWFDSVVNLTDRTLFGIAPEGPHRDAVVLDVLRRSARTLAESDIDIKGNLYTPLCLFLVAACRKLGTPLGVAHWRAGVGNVIRLQEQVKSVQAESDQVGLGLEFGSPTGMFKGELNQAINNSGLGSVPSFLDRGNSEIALGLAVNWAIRFLLAYAIECEFPAKTSSRRDLSWIAGLLDSIAVMPPAVSS